MSAAKTAIFVALSLLSCGCTAYPVMNRSTCPARVDSLVGKIEMKAVFDALAEELCGKPTKPCAGNPGCIDGGGTILVTDFHDLQTLGPGYPGLVMGELMRGSLNKQCGYKIAQAELSENFRLNDKGLVALTREIDRIRTQEVPMPELLIGTYSYSNNRLWIVSKLFSNATGKATKISTREISFSCGEQGVETVVK